MKLAAKTLAISLSVAAGLTAQSNYGSACVGSNGKSAYLSYPASSWLTIPSTGETVTLVDGVPGAPAVLWFGRNPADALNLDLTPIGMPGCFQLVAPRWTRTAMGGVIGMDGRVDFLLPVVPPGQEFAFQALFLDTVQGRAIPVSTSDGLVAKMPDVQSAFRLSSANFADPHVFINQFICLDVTNVAFNPALNTFLTQDSDGDNIIDASLMFTFRPLDPNGAGGFIDFVLPDCTAPIGSTVCTLPSTPELRVSYTNSPNSCLGLVPNTTDWAVTLPSGPCFTSDPIDLNLNINGVVVPLQDAQIAGSYVGGSTPTAITDGLVRGFLPEIVAQATFIPPSIPIVGGLSLANLFPGGLGNCAPGDARDTGPDGQTQGWWVYLNYTADAVPVVQ